jgi:hypothetical protein
VDDGWGNQTFTCVCLSGSNTTGSLCEVQLEPGKGWQSITINIAVADVSLADNMTLEAYVLDLVLKREPEAVAEQFEIHIVTDVDGNYAVTVAISSSSDISAASLADSLNDVVEENEWTIARSVENDTDEDLTNDDAEKEADGIPMLVLAVAGLVVLCILLLGILLYRCNTRNRKTFVMHTGKQQFSMPI